MTTSSLVFIDARVSGYENLINGLPSDTEVVVLDSHTDGLEQIAAYLSGRTGIAAIHVLSHGSQGALYLGNTRVDGDYLNHHSAQLANIGSSLSATGDILLYGCNVAQGDVGLQFIQSLASLTGADVAASVDTTGSAALGGNSVLETQSGEVQTLALDASSLDEVLAGNTAPTFMLGDGKVTTNFGSGSDIGRSVTVQGDGKILVAGTKSYNSINDDFALVRYNSDGSLDTSFGSDGKVTTDLNSGKNGGYSVTVQADGKILIAGYVYDGSNGDFALVRYNSDGSLDTSFSSDGTVTTNLSSLSSDSGQSVTVQADGKILVAGYSDENFALVRYNSDGSLDTSFSSDGTVTTSVGSSNIDTGQSVTVQADGKILVVGSRDAAGYRDFALVRYNNDGSLDTSFGSDGVVTTDLGSASDFVGSVTVQADSKILVAGSSNGDFALVRYNSDGSLDTSFSSDGKVTTDLPSDYDIGSSVKVQADGKILVAGYSRANGNFDFALVRYNSDGSLDTSFSSDGKVTTDLEAEDYGLSMTMQTDGKILVAGYSRANGNDDFALVRYNSDGSLDTNFNRSVSSLGGSVTYTENAPAVVLDSDVQIYDAELATVGYGNAVLTLARHGDAQAEDRFSGAGIVAGQSSGDVSVSGTTVGIYTWNAGTLRIVFNSNATQELLNQTARAIAYQNTSDNPTNSIQIDWTFSDGNTGSQGIGGSLETTDSTTVNITAVNDAPTGNVTITGTAAQGQTLIADTSTLNDVDGFLGIASYQWKANGIAITGATGSTYTLTQTEVGQTISVAASYIDSQGTAEAVTSSATTAVINVNDTPTGTVTLTGTATQGQTLTASNTLADVDGLGTVSYQWNVNGSAISGAIGSTYTLSQADVGKTISVTANYTDGQGTAEAVTSAATTAVANVNDAPTGNVTLSGTATQGQTLTAANNLADADGFLSSIGYQWKANGTAITGATGSTYTLTQNEVGKSISVTASYTDGQGTAEAVTSVATTTVTNVNDAPTGTVTITGTATQGQTLTAANTLTDVDGLGTISYQWKANGSAITGATGSTYTLGQAEVGKTISVTASYTDGQGTAEAVTSVATTTVTNVNDAPTGTVTITGTATQGQTLTAANTLADVDGLGSISHQWKANGTAITGATGTTYTLGQADVGKTISVTASYTDAQGTAEAITSSATTAVANVNDAPTGTVTITGTATQGQTLTAANTLADIDGLGTVSYQWKANGTAITGATGSAYTLGQAEMGKTISVTASYTDGQGTAEAITSSATTAVANVNDAPTGTVTLTGTAAEGQTLTAANTLADIDGLGTVSYQWLRGGEAISGATASTYTLTASDAGQSISVRASYTDGQGTLESRTSASVTPVVLEPGVVFGNAEPGQLTTTEAGGTDSFTVALRAVPRGDVTLTFTLSDATEAAFSASGTATHSITFTADNWATPQTVVLLGVDDKPNDGDVAYTISTSVSSEDLRYDGMRSGSGLPVANLIGQTIDNDAPDEEYGDAGGVVTADLIRGGNGASDLYGLSGRDVLYGNNGDDRLYGGYGDDVLYGNADNDNLEGDQGNDKLDGGTGDDTLNGGTGNDTLIGQVGNDNLLGDVGQDTLLGGDGNDTLNGGVDADSMNGGNGADVYYIDNAADVVSDSGTDGAIDTVYIMAYLSGSLTLGNGIDNGTLDDQAGKGNLKGNSGNNALNGNTSNNVLDGGTGNDTIDGGAGVDNLTGGAGSDNLSGGLGNDVLYSGDGDDVVDAGAGNDLIIGGDGAGNDKYVGGAGIDTVKYTSATSGITVDLTKGTATSRLANDAAKIGTDTLNGIESVIAGNYNDMVNGSAVANTLRGEAGNDTLDGKAGNDTLVGGAGNDILIGGAGKDVLTGGAGNDVFKFNTLTESGLTATTRDVITDFVSGQDKIDLSTIDANTALTGNQAFTGLIGANVAFAKAGQLKLVAGVLYGNTDADATAEFSIALTGITTLVNTDFVL